MTVKCDEFIDTYEVNAILFIKFWFLCMPFYKSLIICLAS
jgi:hypothetical protein